MPDWLRWLLAVLAAWRVAQFIAIDDGPFDAMFLLRRALGRYTWRGCPDNPNILEPATGIGRMLECIHCVGKWAALTVALLAIFPTLPGDILLAWWGLAGAQSLIEGKRDATKLARPTKFRVSAGDSDED